MNYIEQFLKDNNLEIGQKFRPKKSNCDIWFDENFAMQGTSDGCKVIFLTEIMTGEFEVKENQQKRWRAKDEERYWYMSLDGCIESYRDASYPTDDFTYAIGNYFQTEEQAKEYKKELIVKQRYADMSDVTKEQILDAEVAKHFASYDIKNDIIHTAFSQRSISGIVYFSTGKKCIQAIEEIGEEDFKKYVLEV